jgi:hypothetical protein
MRPAVCAGSSRRQSYPLMIDLSGSIQPRYRRVPLFSALFIACHDGQVTRSGCALLQTWHLEHLFRSVNL